MDTTLNSDLLECGVEEYSKSPAKKAGRPKKVEEEEEPQEEEVQEEEETAESDE